MKLLYFIFQDFPHFVGTLILMPMCIILVVSIVEGFFKVLIHIFKGSRKAVPTTYCYCPECGEKLLHYIGEDSDDLVIYRCRCGIISKWDFDIAPVPILMSNLKEGEKSE